MNDLPAGLRDAIANGWSGLTALPGHPGEPPLLVCAAPGERLDALRSGGLLVSQGICRAACGRALELEIVDDREDPVRGRSGHRLSLDLADPAARALVRAAATAWAFDLLWCRSGPGGEGREARLRLDREGREIMLDAAAVASERYAEAAAPLGLRGGTWLRAAAGSPCLLAIDMPRDEVLIVAPAWSASGLIGSGPRSVFLGRPAGRARAVTVEVAGRAPAAPRSFVLDMRGADQRRLAKRLAEQDRVVVVAPQFGVDAAPVTVAAASLSPRCRAVIRRGAGED